MDADVTEWPAPNYWCTICDAGAEDCTHTPEDVDWMHDLENPWGLAAEKKAPAAGGHQREGEDQNTNTHEGEPDVSQHTENSTKVQSVHLTTSAEVSK